MFSISRTSHEVRGLKSATFDQKIQKLKSHLTRGAWIEILRMLPRRVSTQVAPHTRCVD